MIGENATAATAAHEILHGAGLADQYNLQTFRPVPGFTSDNIMANQVGGSINDSQVDEILQGPNKTESKQL